MYQVYPSIVVDAITFRYLINLVVHEKFDMRLMIVVTTFYMNHYVVKFILKSLKDLEC